MRFPPLRAFLVAAFLFVGHTAQAQNSPEAQRVINRAKQATGGAAWNKVLGIHEVGKQTDGKYERWTDPVRYGDRLETTTAAGTFVQGYNGGYEWRILTNGAVTGSTEPDVTRRVRTDAFFAAYAYFFPSRFDLRSSHQGQRVNGGHSYEVLRVQPAGGSPRELWFDRSTGLLGMIIDENGPKRTTIQFSDYRRVGKVLVPFQSTISGGDLKAPIQRKAEKIDFAPADRTTFTLSPERVHRGQPPPAAAAPPQPAPDTPVKKRRR